jgi:hypothetical protein
MNESSPTLEPIEQVFRHAHAGVVGLVHNLLGACREQGLDLDWHDGQCRVRSLASGPAEWTEVPLPESVFRAVLARLAVLCNERSPGSVSPYGGEGELIISGDTRTICRVALVNTASAQRVRLTPIPCGAAQAAEAAP